MLEFLIILLVITFVVVEVGIIVGVVYLLYMHSQVIARLNDILWMYNNAEEDEYPQYPPVNGFNEKNQSE